MYKKPEVWLNMNGTIAKNEKKDFLDLHWNVYRRGLLFQDDPILNEYNHNMMDAIIALLF